MRIGGLQKFSLIDYPGKMAAVIFTQGCNFRCRYCHNPQLVLPECFQESIPEEEVFSFLEKRRGQLEAVVVTGGEPTIHIGLIPFLRKIRTLHYLIKLDTNGSNPAVLEKVFDQRLVDYAAMDLKAPLEEYSQMAGRFVDEDRLRKSIRLIIESGVTYEFRTTLVRPFCEAEKIAKIVKIIPDAARYILQPFVLSERVLDQRLLEEPQYTAPEVTALKQAWSRDAYR